MHLQFMSPKGALMAEVNQENIDSSQAINMEGNWYLDESLVKMSYLHLEGEGKNYHCPIKNGDADYYNLVHEGENVSEIAWIYPNVGNSSFAAINGKVAFWKGKFQLVQS